MVRTVPVYFMNIILNEKDNWDVHGCAGENSLNIL
jgi:hypothetical protein